MSFEPKILGFLCNWCSYAGADLAGVSRVQYPTTLRIIRLMCSGRVDPMFVIEALKEGIDGVIIMGCHIGDCHYMDGNHEALRKVALVKKLLKKVNLDNRVHLEWVSASEGTRFGEVIKQFNSRIKDLGPSPLADDEPDKGLMENMKIIEQVIQDFTIKALVARQRTVTEQGNVYGEKIPEDQYNSILDDAIEAEFQQKKILSLMEKGSMSVLDLSGKLNTDTREIFNHINTLRQNNLVELDRIDDITPIYKIMGC